MNTFLTQNVGAFFANINFYCNLFDCQPLAKMAPRLGLNYNILFHLTAMSSTQPVLSWLTLFKGLYVCGSCY